MGPALVLALGCVAPTPFPADTRRWTEVSLSAQGNARIETEVQRETHTPGEAGRGAPGGVLGTRVLHTRGEVTIGSASPLRFDSTLPRPGDPWVLRWQHAISQIPATVTLDARGRPVALDDPDGWRQAAAEAIAVLPVPPGGPPPLDAERFVADLARTFPGLPPEEGPWIRPEPIAGVDVLREESCAREGRRDGAARVRCEGWCRAASDAGPQLFETTCWTEVWFDRQGLVGVETGYSGTRVWMEGGMVNDTPIAGQRLLVRDGGSE